MKLYEASQGMTIRLLEYTSTPPGAVPSKIGEVYVFHCMDGMYGICSHRDGYVVYVHANAEVEAAG